LNAESALPDEQTETASNENCIYNFHLLELDLIPLLEEHDQLNYFVYNESGMKVG
jgi:hypothetical protein